MDGFAYGISADELISIVDNMYDELLVYDKDYNIVYINKACSRHYGCDPDQMIGKNFYDFVHADWWGPSILPKVYKEKRSYAIKQSTYLGSELLTIAVPIFDDKNEIKYVAMNVRDTVNKIDLYNPQSMSYKKLNTSVQEPVYASEKMYEVIQEVERQASLDTSCIFFGEPGVGKTMLAKYMHALSKRQNEPFAYLDCSNLSDERGQKELFGTEEMPGLLYNMRSGTVLLKKISELSINLQTQCLQYLTGELNFPGEQRARILATSEKELQPLIEDGRFLKELYYHLSTFTINVPSLKERPEDIRPLIHFFVGKYCSKYSLNRSFTEGALQIIENSDWPGNVFQLQNTIKHMVVTSRNPVISAEELPQSLFGFEGTDAIIKDAEVKTFDDKMAILESAIVCDAYQECGSSRAVAKKLGISQTRANNLIRKYVRK